MKKVKPELPVLVTTAELAEIYGRTVPEIKANIHAAGIKHVGLGYDKFQLLYALQDYVRVNGVCQNDSSLRFPLEPH